MEVEDFTALKGCPWPDFWAGSGNGDAKKAVATAVAGGIAHFRGGADTAKGNPRFWDVRVSPIFDQAGTVVSILSISRDITEEWKSEKHLRESLERQALLSAELSHRIKNTLAMVGAIANQTMRGDSVSDARTAFAARLMTLSHAHDILTQTSWSSAPIRDVLEGALAPHRSGHGKFTLDGPNVMLLPKQALALAVATHELATNAAKYGALSADGSVQLSWTDSDDRFSFKWRELGVPSVVTAPTKKGFGSRLIEKMLASDFGGTVEVTYDADGLRCELHAPALNKTLDEAGEDGCL